MKYKEGELVYVPSEVAMNKYNLFGAQKYVTEHRVTKNPEYLLVVDRGNISEVGVFFHGDTWFVSEKDVYNGD
jgi:type IV secretory pathway VirD2 relaxase